MSSPRSAAQLLLVLLVAASVACDDPFRPYVRGAYVLRRVRGDPLPALFWQTDQAQMRVLADTLTLNADGTGNELWHIELTNHLGTTTSRSERPLQFEVHGNRLGGTYLCPPGAPCLAMVEPIRGEFTRAGLRLDEGMYGAGPVVFDRTDR
jgi:hypothetical protein